MFIEFRKERISLIIWKNILRVLSLSSHIQ